MKLLLVAEFFHLRAEGLKSQKVLYVMDQIKKILRYRDLSSFVVEFVLEDFSDSSCADCNEMIERGEYHDICRNPMNKPCRVCSPEQCYDIGCPENIGKM